ncbi:MAG: folP [Rhodoglobus sp.]|nr:folP [Rhodoglobus sp.]
MTGPLVMGILNVTPDSFSDGGQFAGLEQAVARGLELRAQGADVVDVGGESTRPGAGRVPAEEELDRVIPVISELVAAGVTVSVDTMNAATALAAADAGASIINDVSGGLADPAMYTAVVDTGLTYVAMHWRGFSTDMQQLASYGDVVADVRNELKTRLAEMTVTGIDPQKVVLDPGLGFAKTAEHNWKLLAHLDELASLGHPLLIGASRKSFLAQFAADGAPPPARDEASAIVAALAAHAGAWGVRVHDVPATVLAMDVVSAWQNGRQ